VEIKYLTLLRDNPIRVGFGEDKSIRPMSLQEIGNLEHLYNNNNPFPLALKELLFLAGNYCYVLDYGIFPTRQEMQEFVRVRISRNNRQIIRPFFAVDVYNGGEQFIFVYLDEGDNPPTYEGHYYFDPSTDDGSDWITPVTSTLSGLIDHGINRVKQGQNPF